MKKLYITLLSSLFLGQVATAQTLTKAANEPVVGNTNSYKGYDSSGVIPKNTGANMSWNFSAITQNTAVSSATFVAPGSVPSSSAYPSATIVEDQGNNSYVFYKSVATPTTSFESLGYQTPNLSLTFTNSAIGAVWPIGFGYSYTDTYSGNVTQPVTGTLAGTITTTGSGTGTITLPGGTVLSNILQVRTKYTTTLTSGSGFSTITGTILATDYSYYHSSEKFELLTVSYQKQTLNSIGGPTVTSGAGIRVNSAVIQGLTDNNFNSTFQIFPNPAKDAFNINLTNTANVMCTVEIYNSIGALSKVLSLGNSPQIKQTISLADLSPGLYIVKTTMGTQSSSRRLIIE